MANKKVTKFNRDIKINAATCVIAAILLYVIIVVIISSQKEPITIYKVNKSNISNNIILDGLAVRDERIINSNANGYLCYYVRDGEKTSKFSTVCTIDQTGEIYNIINDSEEYDELFTEENYSDIRSIISLYKVNYNDVTYYNSYIFENNINNKVLNLTSEILMQQVDVSNISSNAITTPYSGLVTYYVDGFENYDISHISQVDFDQSKYKKQTLKTGDSVTANTPIFKIIPSENWSIIAPISAEQINALGDRTKITFYINNSSFTASMPYEIINGTDGTYIKINLNKYLSNYMSERYLTVEIIMDEDIGLKVPMSAITEKDVYKIPIEYFSAGSNQSISNKLNIQIMGEDGEITIKQISPTIYTTDDEYCYVDPLVFEDTDVLLNINTNNTLAVSLLSTSKITGVYCANRGTAEFTMITIIKNIDEFALIESDGSLKIYDNIVLDATTVKENQLIY